MINFAILENNKLTNIVKTEEEFDIAKQVLSMMFPNSNIIQINDDQKSSLLIGSEFIDNKFYDPRPFPSWILKNDQWHPPVDIPENNEINSWNESSQQWEKYTNVV